MDQLKKLAKDLDVEPEGSSMVDLCSALVQDAKHCLGPLDEARLQSILQQRALVKPPTIPPEVDASLLEEVLPKDAMKEVQELQMDLSTESTLRIAESKNV
eukprot:7407517-Lingulodinium_polyedra.AAC.1